MTIWSVTFWKACAERALATFAQTLAAVIGVDLIGIHVIDWPTVLAIAATAALLSVLKSVAVGNMEGEARLEMMRRGRFRGVARF